MPVSVFTDGYVQEFNRLFGLKNIILAEKNPDIVDMLLLSQSKIIDPTHGSTFSIWPHFLSDAPLICYANYKTSLRPEIMGKKVYEGIFQPGEELLIANIKSVL